MHFNNMVGLFQKFKPKEFSESETSYTADFGQEYEDKKVKPEHILLAGAGLEILRDLQDKIERLDQRLDQLEKTIGEKIPGKVLTEEVFKEEIQDGDEFADKIISEVKAGLAEVKSIANRSRSFTEIVKNKIEEVEKPTLVEAKRMDGIMQLLQQHRKLTSVQLAQLMSMSRTRSNEYFKQMESLGIIDSEIIGKEKYYKIIEDHPS
jgi:hypothetical protein